MALKRTRLIRKTSRDGRCQGISNLISFILGVGETDRRANVAVMSVLNADVHGTNLAIVLPSSVIEDLIDQMHYRPGTAHKDAKQARDRPVNYYYKPCMNTEFSCSWRCVCDMRNFLNPRIGLHAALYAIHTLSRGAIFAIDMLEAKRRRRDGQC